MRLRFFYWLIGKYTPPTTHWDKTLDGLTLQESKALACILAYWLAAESVEYGYPAETSRLMAAKRVWIALGKDWIAKHPDFAAPTEGDGIPVRQLFEVKG